MLSIENHALSNIQLVFFPDINECLNENVKCDMNADCIDVNNTVDEELYKCKCKEGFIDTSEKQDGTSCRGTELFLFDTFISLFVTHLLYLTQVHLRTD